MPEAAVCKKPCVISLSFTPAKASLTALSNICKSCGVKTNSQRNSLDFTMPFEVTSTAIEVWRPVDTKRIRWTRASSDDGVVAAAAAFVSRDSTDAVLAKMLSGAPPDERMLRSILSLSLSGRITGCIRLSM